MYAKKQNKTGGWDIFLGPPERARAETVGADQWVLRWRELQGFPIVNEKKTPASRGYPLSVFNKNSALKHKQKHTKHWVATARRIERILENTKNNSGI